MFITPIERGGERGGGVENKGKKYQLLLQGVRFVILECLTFKSRS